MNRFAQENGLMFLETSAKTGDSVEEAFLKCSKNILAKIESGELDPERIGSGNVFIGSLCTFVFALFKHFHFVKYQGRESSSVCFFVHD